jgi:energy-coupling factor transporter ATP-binding protein EcfA2
MNMDDRMTYGFDQRPNTRLTDVAEALVGTIKSAEYAVLVGRNNCGKSFLLKTLTEQIGQEAAYIGPARYTNFNSLNFYTPQPDKKSQWWRQFVQWSRQNHNIDNSPINLQQAIAQFDDTTREGFFEIVRSLLGVDIEIKKADPSNEMSQRYLSCDGHNLSFTSSGVRLIASILTCLLDKDYRTILIDEPELGISPEAQGILADFLFDSHRRKKYFSHIETLIFATHSTVFLDRKRIENNYVVSKNGDLIDIAKVNTQQDFNRIHFFLLGNRFETLYLPSGIIIVEGKCDELFIKRILEVECPKTMYSVIRAGNDSRIKEIVHMASSFFADMQKSPYRDRIFPIVDSIHAHGLIEDIEKMGISRENIIEWSENGIEHYYPNSVIDDIYGIGSKLEIRADDVSRNGISYKKFELSEKVSAHISTGLSYPMEFEQKFLQKMRAISE